MSPPNWLSPAAPAPAMAPGTAPIPAKGAPAAAPSAAPAAIGAKPRVAAPPIPPRVVLGPASSLVSAGSFVTCAPAPPADGVSSAVPGGSVVTGINAPCRERHQAPYRPGVHLSSPPRMIRPARRRAGQSARPTLEIPGRQTVRRPRSAAIDLGCRQPDRKGIASGDPCRPQPPSRQPESAPY